MAPRLPFPGGRRLAVRLARLLALWLLLLAGPAAARAQQDLVMARAYWEEPACARVELAQVPSPSSFVPFSGVLALGYKPCAVWLRLRVEAPLSDEPLVLRMLPAYLDQIEVFEPAVSPARLGVVGDRVASNRGAYRALTPHLLLPDAAAGSEGPRELLLRLETSSTRLIDVQVLPLSQALDRDRLQELFYSVYLALLVLSLLTAGIHWLRSRERVIGVFVLKQTLAVAYSLLLLGYGGLLPQGWLAPAQLDGATSVLLLVFTAASIWFDRQLLHEYRPPRAGVRMLLALMALLPLELALVAFGQAWLALAINAAAVVVAAVTVSAMLLRTRPRPGAPQPPLPHGLLVGFYAMIIVPLLISTLTVLGLLPGQRLSLFAQLLHGLLTGVVLLALLALRAHRLGLRQAEVVAELALARQLAQRERVHREDREQLLSMLTHELKTPLSVVRMLLGTGQPDTQQVAHIQRALSDMNDVVERCAQADLLAGNRLQAMNQPFDLRAELEAVAAHWQGPQPLTLEVDGSARPLGQGAALLLQTDPQLLRIVLSNLLDNARKYSPPGSAITLRLSRCAEQGRDGLAVEVANLPGPAGWPEPRHLFQKYYRSPSAHRQTGSGLGLFLTAGLAQLLRGHVAYQPTATHVRFRLWLPL